MCSLSMRSLSMRSLSMCSLSLATCLGMTVIAMAIIAVERDVVALHRRGITCGPRCHKLSKDARRALRKPIQEVYVEVPPARLLALAFELSCSR